MHYQNKGFLLRLLAVAVLLLLVFYSINGFEKSKESMSSAMQKPQAKLNGIKSSVKSVNSRKKIYEPPSQRKMFRFMDGLVGYNDKVSAEELLLAKSELLKMSATELELQFERMGLMTTASCSHHIRYGLLDDGGYNLCLVGPFTPQTPCLVVSFGIGFTFAFDEQLGNTYKCQVLSFDPTIKKPTHRHTKFVSFFKEGISGSPGTLHGWKVDSLMNFLKRFGAENLLIDVLKIDVEMSEWAALETAVKDGSLKNVKQLLMEFHVFGNPSVEERVKQLEIMRELHNQGFRAWRHYTIGTGTKHICRCKINPDKYISCCFEVNYININFLNGKGHTNPSGSKISDSLLPQNYL